MIYNETENSVSVVTRTYPREKYGEIKGKHGVYFVYAEAFELCPDVMVRFKGQDRITEVLNVLLQSWDWICR